MANRRRKDSISTKNKYSGKYNGQRYDVRAQIIRSLTEYSDEVSAELEKTCRALAKEGSKRLKLSSPRSDKQHKHYADGWTSKVTKSSGKVTATVYNKTKPGLTHLLEFGFINAKTGRRVFGEEHIGHVEKWMGREFFKRVDELIGGDGDDY